MSSPLFDDLAEIHHRREVPQPRQLTDRVWSVPIPLTGSPLGFIVVYAIDSSEGLVLIDAAYEVDACWVALGERLAQIGRRVADVRAVLITHNHPDHVGQADRIRAASGAEVFIDRDDDFTLQKATRGGFLEQLRRVLAASGAPATVADDMYADAVSIAEHSESLVADTVLEGDVPLRFGDVEIMAIAAPGHTPGHRIYAFDDVVFTGDTLMPEGSVQIATPSLPDDAPACDLLRTLDTIIGLGARVALPAHQYPYLDPAARARELRDLHGGELARVGELAGDGATAWELAPRLEWAKPWDRMGLGTRRFALVHTQALLQSLPR